MDKRNLELVADFYEFTMSNAYYIKNMKDTVAYFDLFIRSIPDNGGYIIFAGLEQIIEYIKNLKFDDSDIEYLRNLNKFSPNFIDFLKDFKFEGDIFSIPEGTVVFANEPLITVRAPIIQAQLIETALLLLVNHQSLIATKASRIVAASQGRPVMEFGARRAHNVDAAVYGARAAIIGGCIGTSCVDTAKKYNSKPSGTMAHSFIQSFDSEYEAFKAYAEIYPDDCTLLIDTYHTLESGVVNAIKVFNEVIIPKGFRPKAVRLDSGDLAYLSKQVRKLLDEAGFQDCKICGTNELDEYLITSLLLQDAKIDFFGVGESLITSKSDPILSGVYKLVAVEKNGTIIPKIKISDNTTKITNPSFKKLYRFYDKNTNMALADLIAVHDEEIDKDSYVIFDPENSWKKKELTNYFVKELQVPIFEKGKLVYTSPSLKEIAETCKHELNTFWDEVKRIRNPHNYYVDLSEKLWNLKNDMLSTK
jgi:nicotinate phosphoribosyltransferase